MSALPDISVLMLSHNHAPFIERAVASVFAAAVDGITLELLVIDDGSTDGTIELLRKQAAVHGAGMRLFEQPHRGIDAIAQNINALIGLAHGRYVAFIASDDEFLPQRFTAQWPAMEHDARLAVTFANGTDVRNGKAIRPVHNPDTAAILRSGDAGRLLEHVTTRVPGIYLQTVLVRRDFLDSYRAFDNDLIADDWVFLIKTSQSLQLSGRGFAYFDEPVFTHNLHDSNSSHDRRAHFERVRQVVARYVTRNASRILADRVAAYLRAAARDLDLGDLLHFGALALRHPYALLRLFSKRVW